ncbi:MAG TPA: adenylate/guanylate cyclase domain-containing protein, partial [Anaerolineales bacterium]|nr:adenylate/guanylate cyclase domain-containing protein [Anaerolineales bacterium]
MLELPSGTITFLFSDIEGSTPLWERSPRAMQAALACHNSILQNSIERHNGQVFKVIGDAFQAAFTLPAQAVAAALEAQRALAAEAWSESGPIRVRMGIHSGPAEVGEGDYLASHTLNRVARITSAGHGGQVLLSAAVADHVRGLLPEDVSLKDLGEHFLKGLSHPERIFQLLAPELRPDFPPLVTRITPRGYKLLEQIGAGGFGAVYRALQPEVGREVAIKVILPQFANDPEFIRRFETEAQLVARLEHPHIVPLYDYWREPDSAFLIMRLLRGGSLENVLERGPLNLAQAAELLEQLAGALTVAHREGV